MIPRIFFDVAWKIYETAHKWKREKDFPLVIYISTPYIFDSQGASNPFMERAGSKEPEKKVTKHRTATPSTRYKYCLTSHKARNWINNRVISQWFRGRCVLQIKGKSSCLPTSLFQLFKYRASLWFLARSPDMQWHWQLVIFPFIVPDSLPSKGQKRIS